MQVFAHSFPVACNAGKTASTMRPLTQKQIGAIRFIPDRQGRLCDRAPFDLTIDCKLCGWDLIKLKIRNLVAGPDIQTRNASARAAKMQPG